jgi:hypothetical protein
MYPFGTLAGDIVVTNPPLSDCDNGNTGYIDGITGFPYFGTVKSLISVSSQTGVMFAE